MDFENTLSNANTADTPETGETAAPVIVMQNDAATASVRSVTLDTPTLETTSTSSSVSMESAGLPAVVRSVFGDYHQRTQTVTETSADGTATTSTEPVPGLAGLDWYWLSGVFLFTIVLWSFFRFLGVVFKR